MPECEHGGTEALGWIKCVMWFTILLDLCMNSLSDKAKARIARAWSKIVGAQCL